MPVPLHTPRINNNDDTVRLAKIFVEVGAAVRQGDPVADIETDKATFTVEAEQDGFLLGVAAQPGETINVGSILAWFGATADEPLPQAVAANGQAQPASRVSLKAALLLAQYSIEGSQVPASGDRLTESDVRSYIDSRGLAHGARTKSRPVRYNTPPAPGRNVNLSPIERGMLRTVEWHRDEAVAGYVEIRYDPSEWDEYAAEFQKSHRLLLSPLLSLLAWKLAQMATARPEINATIAGEDRYVYDHVNLGFTVQSGDRLYMVVVPEAESLSEEEFVEALGALQRSAMKQTLGPSDTSGATLAFSSMARWPVTRHVPVLAPHTSLIVAHTAPHSGGAALGATYDHRVLSGAAAVRILQALARPRSAG